MAIERPFPGGDVALGDDDLARIGLAVVLESSAKSTAASALRALCALSDKEWVRLERMQFGQILKRIEVQVASIADAELNSRFRELTDAVQKAHQSRHIVVHVAWATGEDGSLGYDFTRERLVKPGDIQQAVDGCAEMKRAASWFAMRVANLIEEGTLQERSEGRGMSIRTMRGLVRL